MNAAADYEMYLHLARHHPVHDHGQVVADYRRHDANMSGNAGRMLRETLAVMCRQRPLLEGDDASLRGMERRLAHWQDFYGTHLADADPGVRSVERPLDRRAARRPRVLGR